MNINVDVTLLHPRQLEDSSDGVGLLVLVEVQPNGNSFPIKTMLLVLVPTAYLGRHGPRR